MYSDGLNMNKYRISFHLNNRYILHFPNKDGVYACVCGLCSEPLFLQETGIEHFYKEHKEWFELIWLSYERKKKEKNEEKVKRPKYRVHIKPWKNPNSLFCDTEFLEKLTGKKILEGDECRDKI